MNETPIIGFIGAGRMAAALARGFVDSGLVAPENLIASDPVPAGRKAFGQAVGCETTDSNADVLAKAKVIFLAFKPHQLDEAMETVRAQFADEHIQLAFEYTTVDCYLDHAAAHAVHHVGASRHRLDVAARATKRALPGCLHASATQVRVFYELVHKVVIPRHVGHTHQVHAPVYGQTALGTHESASGPHNLGVYHVAVATADVFRNLPAW